MTEPYPSTEVESKLKHLFRSLTRARRAYKDTRNHALTLLHQASAAVLAAVLVCRRGEHNQVRYHRRPWQRQLYYDFRPVQVIGHPR